MGKALCVQYSTEDYFNIPDGIDLNNKEQVLDYKVRYGTLYIRFADDPDHYKEIDRCYRSEIDYKYPNYMEILDKQDTPYYESDADTSEAEEEDEQKED
jgi:hypothetical protein